MESELATALPPPRRGILAAMRARGRLQRRRVRRLLGEHRRRGALRAVLSSGLQPWPAAAACALGAGIGVAPLPGLQFICAAVLSWRLGLNIPLVLLMSNLSFGPLLLVWGATCASVGIWLRTGASPLAAYRALAAEFAGPGVGFSALLPFLRHALADWLLGSLLVVPAVGLVAGAVGYGVARALQRQHPGPGA